MAALRLVLLLTACVVHTTAERFVFALDHGWRFQRDEAGGGRLHCSATDFAHDLTGMNTNANVDRSAGVKTETDCATACCNCGADCDNVCTTYQFCNSSACGGLRCLVGTYGGQSEAGKGWFSRVRDSVPTPAPAPPPGSVCGASESWCQPGLDDSGWRTVSVPHDFVLEGNFTQQADLSHGFLPYAIGYYRKRISLPAGRDHPVRGLLRGGSHVAYLQFDGVQANAAVYLNGQGLGGHRSGYTPFTLPLSASATNALLDDSSSGAVLAVRADATRPDGWWYDGGGIYRRARLIVLPLQHLALSGGAYLPSMVTGVISGSTALARTADAELAPVVSAVNLDGASAGAAKVRAVVSLRDAAGALVNTTAATATLTAGPSNATLTLPTIVIPRARLWSPESPTLYEATVSLFSDGDVNEASTPTLLDEIVTHIGVRKTFWDASTGFSLNGVPTKILGAANHQDFAGLGVAIPDTLQAHRIAKLKQMGANGWRTAHNPPNPALLDAADRLGFLVWDENHRNGRDQVDELESLVLRDRNHPSVVIWSICNEKLCDTGKTNRADAALMAAKFKELDPAGGRVVSANYNDWNGNDTMLDVQGIDYATNDYDNLHTAAPHVPAISSETSSAVGDRGEYTNDAAAGHVRGYDTEAPGWGQTAEGAWGGVGQADGQGILTRDFVAGGFTWTGWDYKGEPTPLGWPDVNSHFGILDEAGFEKDRFHWYKAWFPQYRHGDGVVHLFPHWNWAARGDPGAGQHLEQCSEDPARHGRCNMRGGGEGNMTVEMWAYSNADEVELFVNGVSVGVSSSGNRSHASWMVPYVAGEVRAVARMADGTEVATETRTTTGPAAALRASIKDRVGADTSVAEGHNGGIIAGCNDVALVQVEVVDATGRTVPTATNNISFAVDGPGQYVGGGNGDPACHVSDSAAERPAFHGLVLGIVRSPVNASASGTIRVHVTSPGLASDTIDIKVSSAHFNSKWWCGREPQL